MHPLRLSLAFLLACWCADGAQGQSFGRWHLPSTTAQVFGYGNGAGHHAPMVRSLGCQPDRVPRVAFVPCNRKTGPTACSQANIEFIQTAPSSCSSGNCSVHLSPQTHQQPTYQQPTYQQTAPAPQVIQTFPTPAALPQIFAAPAPPTPPEEGLADELIPAPPMPAADPTNVPR